MATTRLRKAFKYPSEDEDSSDPEGLDEEEQEQLINQYIEADAAKTEGYKVCTPPTLFSPARPNTEKKERNMLTRSDK
jgi:hypothetical protein